MCWFEADAGSRIDRIANAASHSDVLTKSSRVRGKALRSADALQLMHRLFSMGRNQIRSEGKGGRSDQPDHSSCTSMHRYTGNNDQICRRTG